MNIVMFCCLCSFVGETGEDLVCSSCGEVGYRPHYEPVEEVTVKDIQGMNRMMNFRPRVKRANRESWITQAVEKVLPAGKIQELPRGFWERITETQ